MPWEGGRPMKKVIIICVLVVVLVMFFGCKQQININDQEFKEVAGYEVATMKEEKVDGEKYTVYKLLYSKTDLFFFNLKYNIKDYTNKYDRDYFKDKALVVCLFQSPHAGSKFEVNTVKISKDYILVEFNERDCFEMDYVEVLCNWICILELNKDDVKKSLIVITDYQA